MKIALGQNSPEASEAGDDNFLAQFDESELAHFERRAGGGSSTLSSSDCIQSPSVSGSILGSTLNMPGDELVEQREMAEEKGKLDKRPSQFDAALDIFSASSFLL